jgi:hypothetical protein
MRVPVEVTALALSCVTCEFVRPSPISQTLTLGHAILTKKAKDGRLLQSTGHSRSKGPRGGPAAEIIIVCALSNALCQTWI